MDYKVWATMEQRLCQRKIRDIDKLREQLTATWRNLEQSIIDSAIDQWRKRLTACVKADTLNISYNLLRVNIIFACDRKRILNEKSVIIFWSYGVFLGDYNVCMPWFLW